MIFARGAVTVAQLQARSAARMSRPMRVVDVTGHSPMTARELG